MEWKQINVGARKIIKYFCQDPVNMVLLNGTAEIDGSEIALRKNYTYFSGDFGIIFTHYGCEIQFSGQLIYYISTYPEENSTPNLCINIHACLEKYRLKSLKVGPRVMICGNNGYAKTRLSRTLVNYKLRDFKDIIYIDAELNYTDLCMPGSISAVRVTQPYDIADGWNISDDTIVFNFGHLIGIKDPELYVLQLSTLADLIDKKFKNDLDLAKSGLILNLDSLDDGDSSLQRKEERATIIATCVHKFQIDHVFVIEDGFLEKIIKNNLNRKINVINLPIPSQRINSYEREEEMRGKIISNYFTGQGSLKIHLRTFVLNPAEFHIYKFELPNSENKNRLIAPIEMEQKRQFLFSYLAISQAKEVQDISIMPIYGYVMVVDITANGLKIISPAAQALPSNILLFTYVKSKNFA